MKIAKTIAAGIAAAAAIAIEVLSDDAVSAAEIGQIAAFLAGVAGVYWVPNR
jgi:hypothetical protein